MQDKQEAIAKNAEIFHYVLMKKSEYSQENTMIALDKFNFIINAYPNSKYEIDILTKVKLINNNLAAEKLNIAKMQKHGI